MLTSSLFATTDLLDAALTLIELQDEQLSADESGADYNEPLDMALTEASDKFDYLVAEKLADGQSDALDDAIDTLSEAGKQEASEFLLEAVQQASTRSYGADGELFETRLVPVVVSRETGQETLTPQQCKTLATIYSTHFEGHHLTKVTVSPRLRDADEIYHLRYHEVQELNNPVGVSIRHLLTQGFHPFVDELWTPALRFLVINTVTQLATGADLELEEDFESSIFPEDEPDEAQLLAQELPTIQDLSRALANEMAVTYGTPLICGGAANVYTARAEGMVMYAHKVAQISISRQLAATELKPTQMIMTLHTEEDEGEDSDVCQIRVSVLGEGSVLLAGHILECGDWLSAADAGDIVILMCKWAGLTHIDQANDVLEILDAHMEPFFCVGQTWDQLPENTLRVTQRTYD